MVCSWNKALSEIKLIIKICIMIISLDFVEKILVERGFTTREAIDKRKQSNRYGKSECFFVRKFKKVAREDYTLFFQSEHHWKNFNKAAGLLFKNGG